MFDRQSIHIALLLWGCIFSLIAAVCVFMSKNFDKEKRKWFDPDAIVLRGFVVQQCLCLGIPGKGTKIEFRYR